jgi:hypothetical protein
MPARPILHRGVLAFKPMHLPFFFSARDHGTARRPRVFVVAAAAALAGFAVSCASPGSPRPPSLHLARVVTDLTAERIGNRVRLRWTTPDHTTDDLPVPAPLTAEICRETSVPPSRKSPDGIACNVVVQTQVKPGASEASETLPAPLLADPVTTLRYRVRLLNPDGRSAGESMAVLAPSGAVPAPVLGLRATASRQGAILEWTPIGAPAVVELERRLAVSAQPEKPTSSKGAVGLAGDEQPVEVHLLSGDPQKSGTTQDPGGTLDRTAQRGDGYLYRAQRLRTVTVGGQTMELRSELSAPAALQVTDTFPPSAPTGLASVPSTSNGKAAIDLSWQPDADLDLAGYNIYRKAASGSFVRVNTAPIKSPAYTDATVTPATSYVYRITAVDASGNESPPSAEITETAQQSTP